MQVNAKYLKDENNTIISPITSINSVVGSSGKLLLNIIYPIGSYYETSDITFNPNTEWIGTWVQDTKGQVMVSKSDGGYFKTINDNIGSDEFTLTTDNLPNHSHSLDFPVNPNSGGGRYDTGYFTSGGGNADWSQATFRKIANYSGNSKSFPIIQNSKVCIRWHRTA